MTDEDKAIPSEAPDAPWNYHTPGPEFEFDNRIDGEWSNTDDIWCQPGVFHDVQRPAHYNQGEFEVIDIIQDKLTPEQFKGYCLGNQLKYVLRHEYKGNPKQDLEKAMWYFKRMMEALYGRT